MRTAKNLGALWGLAFALAATGWAQPLTLSSPPLPFGSIGANYNTNLSATGGSGNYHFAVATGNLPPGLQIQDERPFKEGIDYQQRGGLRGPCGDVVTQP